MVSVKSGSIGPWHATDILERHLLSSTSCVSTNLQVPGRSLLPCHGRRHILPYIVGEDEEEHDDELPDEEPAFLPVERAHHVDRLFLDKCQGDLLVP